MIYDSHLKMTPYKLSKALPAELSENIKESEPVLIKNPPSDKKEEN